MNGLGVGALVALAAAIAIQVALPAGWPLAFAVLLVGANYMAGNFIMRSFRVVDEGAFNYAWFVVLNKRPRTAAVAAA